MTKDEAGVAGGFSRHAAALCGEDGYFVFRLFLRFA
jgi:hypothetical protein